MPLPRSAEGIVATRLTPAMIQKMVCIGAMNRPAGGPEDSEVPAKTACKTFGGILVASTAKEIERLRSAPVVTSVADIPEAIPRSLTGAELMMELMFGATNIPPPIPTRIISRAKIP